LSAEYVVEKLSKATWYQLGQPLGPPVVTVTAAKDLRQAIAESRPWRPEVDIAAVFPGHIEIIEVKIWKLVDGISKLPFYKALVPNTPELVEYRNLPIIMKLVCPWVTDSVMLFAQEAGVNVEVFSQPWVEGYVQEMHAYWTRDARIAREIRLERIRKMEGK